MALPAPYLQILDMLAVACTAYEKVTGFAPVLVGGGAVAIQTQGAFMSGDFDLFAPNDKALDRGLRDAGFVAEERLGRLKGGYYHPQFPGYGIEAISGQLFDGRADRERLIRLTFTGDHAIVIPSFEDMIADRLGQHAAAAKSDRSRLEQAQTLFRLARDLDLDYLRLRVHEEGGDFRLLDHAANDEKGGV
jgi:hypothetical protein